MFNLFRIRPAGVLSCLLVGLFSQALYNMFYMRTIKESGMAVAAVLLYTSPVFVALMSRIFFRESLGKNKAVTDRSRPGRSLYCLLLRVSLWSTFPAFLFPSLGGYRDSLYPRYVCGAVGIRTHPFRFGLHRILRRSEPR